MVLQTSAHLSILGAGQMITVQIEVIPVVEHAKCNHPGERVCCWCYADGSGADECCCCQLEWHLQNAVIIQVDTLLVLCRWECADESGCCQPEWHMQERSENGLCYAVFNVSLQQSRPDLKNLHAACAGIQA